jgi:hypothetical protein
MKCFEQKDDMDTRRALDITGFGDMGTFTWENIREQKKELMFELSNFIEDFNSDKYEEYEILKDLEYYNLKLRALNYLERLFK